MKTMQERLQFISRGSMVRRFHQHAQLAQDTTGRHSHGVAMLCTLLCDGAPGEALLLAALTHDAGELVAGDVPAPTKRVLRTTNFDLDAYEAAICDVYGFKYDLDAAEHRALKLADALDGMLACAREVAMGNRTVVWVYKKWTMWLPEFGALSKTERAVIDAVHEIWLAACQRPDAGYQEPEGVPLNG